MRATVSGDSQPVSSNQVTVHKDLLEIVTKHVNKPFNRPIASHTARAFSTLEKSFGRPTNPIILDSGCGSADSSATLAANYPEHLIIGVDKSANRLSRFRGRMPSNVQLIHAELIDIWRLLLRKKLPIAAHYIFYPNPWPKGKHLKRRWHGHPVFPAMMKLSPQLTLRTNWEIYALEFVAATERLVDLGAISGQVGCSKIQSNAPISAFEKKYLASGHELFEVTFERSR
ncbi:MAG: tRNA (guanine(46)-N(7))-methyltransferase TrmB [Gammaproteobacteria bacterium]